MMATTLRSLSLLLLITCCCCENVAAFALSPFSSSKSLSTTTRVMKQHNNYYYSTKKQTTVSRSQSQSQLQMSVALGAITGAVTGGLFAGSLHAIAGKAVFRVWIAALWVPTNTLTHSTHYHICIISHFIITRPRSLGCIVATMLWSALVQGR